LRTWRGTAAATVSGRTGILNEVIMKRVGTIAAMLLLGACAQSQAPEREHTAKVRSEANTLGCFPEAMAQEHAACICEDFDLVGMLQTHQLGDTPASLGVNGTTDLVADVLVDGSLDSHAGVDATARIQVRDELRTAGSFLWVGDQSVGGDLSVGGDVDGVGVLRVDGSLRVAGNVDVTGEIESAGKDDYRASDAPCDCRGQRYFDVAMAVADARDHNDNDLLAVDAGDTELRLPSGRFYLTGIEEIGELAIVAQGETALFIDGDVDFVGAASLRVQAGAKLDVYIAGQLDTVGDIELGNPDDPRAFRLFVGGREALMVHTGSQHFAGYIYAPEAALDWVGDLEIHGGLVAKRLDGVGDMAIRYPGPAKTHAPTCSAEPITGPPAERPSTPSVDIY
jgi:hypothetical protein